ncbi:MAG: hypothetical protein JW889_02485 [Verrucomicrobia bacterium]|nr:hypothetical protein [Verrucomicrobiota bacterium]
MTGTDLVTRYAYDVRGNLKTLTDPASQATAFAYDHRDRLVTTTYEDDSVLTYEYDANGNLITRTGRDDQVTEYVYDDLDRLLHVKYMNESTSAVERCIVLGYDDVGRMTSAIVKTGDPDTGTEVSRIERDYNAVGWLTAERQTLGADEKEVLYSAFDDNGAVTELSDSTGALSQAYEYDAWGIATVYDPDHASRNPYMYTGQRWDAALGLYYYRARHYAPQLGRFMQTDPAGYGDGTDLYAYVSGTPTVFIDPTGMEKWDTDWEGDHERAKWITQDGGAWFGGNVEKIDIGEVKGGKLHLRDEYGGAVIPIKDARRIINTHMYMGALAGTKTINHAIKEAFAGRGVTRGNSMLSEGIKGFGKGAGDYFKVLGDHATLGLTGLHEEAIEIQASYDDPWCQASFGAGKVGVELLQTALTMGAGKALMATGRGVLAVARNSRHVATAVNALSKVPGLARAGRAALTGARALGAMAPLAGKAVAVGFTGYSGFEAGRAFAAGDLNAGVHNLGRVGLTIGVTRALTRSSTYRGGEYRRLGANEGTVVRHHMPTDSASPLPTGRGPAIQMAPSDHMRTASWGSSRNAVAFRARHAELIRQGRFTEAQRLDIDDVRSSFGSRYDGAIQEMLDYTSGMYGGGD